MKPPGPLLQFLRLLPASMRGKHRLARALLRMFDMHGITCNDRYGCELELPLASENICFAVLVDGAYEPIEIDLVLKEMPRDGVFLDIGANIGCFSLAVGKSDPLRTVVALEPAPRMFSALSTNIERNGLRNVTALQVAATDFEGPVSFSEMPPDKAGMSTLTAWAGEHAITVQAKRLDDLLGELGIAKVDYLKIDVEGHEDPVFRGASALLSRADAPTIMMEFVDWAEGAANVGGCGAAQRTLRRHGYSIWRIDDYLDGGKAMEDVMVAGGDTLIAKKAR